MTPIHTGWETAEPWQPSVPDEPYDQEARCPDCDSRWEVGLPACPSCGLEESEIAERVTER